MATLDSLQSDIDALSRRVSSLEESSSSHGTSIQNLQTVVGQHTQTLNAHKTRLDDHDKQLEDHDKRLHLLEDSTLKVTLTREGKAPTQDDRGLINVYMPDNLKLEDFEKYNVDVSIAQNFNWFRKISNSVGAGKVCFDFDRQDGIKAILLGQDTRVLIPTGLKITEITPVKSVLKVVNADDLIIKKGLCFGIETFDVNSEEIVVSVSNYTKNTVHIYRGEIIAQLAHVFMYKTNPTVTITNIGG